MADELCGMPVGRWGHLGTCARKRGHVKKTHATAETVAKELARAQIAYAERRAYLDLYKLERGCADCGYRADPRALDFDHDDPTGKSPRWPQLPHFTLEKMLAEIAKCTVRCANCHRIRTFREQDLWKRPD